jgi:hypothetical protein
VDGELPAVIAATCRGPSSQSFWGRVAGLGDHVRRHPAYAAQVREVLAHLQARFDQEAEEFGTEAMALKRGSAADLKRQASLFMEHNLELFEEAVADLLRTRSPVSVST